MRIVSIVILSILITGCASLKQPSTHEVMNSWMGKPYIRGYPFMGRVPTGT